MSILVPEWFEQELQLLSPRLRVRYERYGPQAMVLPLAGQSFMRFVRDLTGRVVRAEDVGGQGQAVTYRYLNYPHPEFGREEFKPPSRWVTPGRIAIYQELRSGGREERILDLVEETGELINPDTRALLLLTTKRDAWDEVISRDAAEAERLRKEAEAVVEAAATPGLEVAFDSFHDMPRVSLAATVAPEGEVHPAGFRIIDRRRREE